MNVFSRSTLRSASRDTASHMLDEATERELLAQVQAGTASDAGRAAMTELWMSHAGLVTAIASKFRRAGIDRDDLIAAGHLGLHTAIARFDATRFDSRLAAYASVWIRWHIQDYIRKNSGPVRLPESKAHRQLAQSGARLMTEARRACDREGVDPTDSELHARVGTKLGLAAKDVAIGLRLIQDGHASLDAHKDDEHETFLPDTAAPTADDMNERMDHAKLRARLLVLANEALGEREREVFLGRCMADSVDVPSLDSLAVDFGVSIARVHQIETSARRKIAAALVKHGYGDAGAGDVVASFSQIRARRAPAAERAPSRERLASLIAAE